MATPHDSPSDQQISIALKNHSPEEPLSNSSSAKSGGGKGKWILCMNKIQNVLLLNRDTPVQSLDPPGLNVVQLQNKRAVRTPKSCKSE